MLSLFEILYEDADLLVVNKPAGLVCHPTKGDVSVLGYTPWKRDKDFLRQMTLVMPNCCSKDWTTRSPMYFESP